ncbi:MAG: hypothetical protein IT581_14235 [Verrucomicrobiales bacterium]|nr:hypothetical protein [Verrucomicrobiales bacterium]
MILRLPLRSTLVLILALAMQVRAVHSGHPLPPEVLAKFSVPDLARWRGPFSGMAPLRLWRDPAMKALRERFGDESHRRWLLPLNQATGVDWAQLVGLTEGRLTWAWLPETPDTNGPSGQISAQLLLLDLGANTNAFDRLLESWSSPTNPLAPRSNVVFASSVVRGVAFRSRSIDPGRWRAVFDAAFPPPPDAVPPAPGSDDAPTWLHLGRVGSIAIATTRRSNLVDIVASLRAPPVPPDAASKGSTGEAMCEGTVERPGLVRLMHLPDDLAAKELTDLPSMDRLKVALGLAGIQRVRCAVETVTNGWILNVGMEIPEAQRRGLFGLARWLQTDASPPPFIPSNVLQFTRLRLNSSNAWNQLERTLGDIDPSILGVFQLFTGYAGRTEDADFDFQARVVGLLGDDWILASGLSGSPPTAARSATNLPGGLLLIGSPRAADLAAGLRTVASPSFLATFFPPDSPEPKRRESEFRGEKVTTVELPSIPWLDGRTGLLQIAASRGYCGMSTDPRWMETFLATNTTASLAAREDVRRAMALAGGAQSGLLMYHDESAAAAAFFGAARNGPAFLENLIRWVAFSDTATRLVSGFSAWLDFTTLPPFDTVASHFGPCVQCGRIDGTGFTLRAVRLETPKP